MSLSLGNQFYRLVFTLRNDLGQSREPNVVAEFVCLHSFPLSDRSFPGIIMLHHWHVSMSLMHGTRFTTNPASSTEIRSLKPLSVRLKTPKIVHDDCPWTWIWPSPLFVSPLGRSSRSPAGYTFVTCTRSSARSPWGEVHNLWRSTLLTLRRSTTSPRNVTAQP